MLAPNRFRNDDFAESVLIARAESARAGIAAAEARLEAIRIEAVEVERLDVLAESARANSIATRFSSWLNTSTPELAEMTAKDAAKLVQARVDRIAATESARAFNEGLLEEARQTATTKHVVLYRVWNAYADACPICEELNGTRTGLFESFPGGDEPGRVHPRCRCVADIRT